MQAAMHGLETLKDWTKDWIAAPASREPKQSGGTHGSTPRASAHPVAPPASTPAPSASAPEQAEDNLLGTYKLAERKPLGVGGYAKVLLAKHISTGRPVAVKVLSSQPVPGEGRGASSEAAVVREVAALRRAGEHEHVCCLFDHYRIGAEDALVMELCNGGELFGLIERQGALGEPEALELFRGVLSGLSHLHSVGIAHRDLKLENVLLGGEANRTPKICDLGLAHVHPPSRTSATGWADQLLTQFCGSRSYCAPEVMGRFKYNGYVADCWCLGVCLFGLVAGFFPVDEASTRDWRFNHVAQLQHRDPMASTCAAIFQFYQRVCPFSPGLVDLCDGLLQVQPHRRWGLPHVAASAWVVGSTTAPAAPEGASSAHGDADPSATLDLSELDGPIYRSVPSEASEEQERNPAITTAAASHPGRAPPLLCRQRAVLEWETGQEA